MSCICPTYGRPELLEEAIQCFLLQDYPGPKELIVLNDFDQQTLIFDHPEVRVINLPRRFASVGQKYTAAVARCAHDLIFVWHDDDIYLPHRLSFSMARLDRQKGFFKADRAWFWNDGQLSGPEMNTFHGGCCFTRDLFRTANGYPPADTTYDRDFEERCRVARPGSCEPSWVPPEEVYYLYRWAGTGSYHLSALGQGGTEHERVAAHVADQASQGQLPRGPIALRPRWRADYQALCQDFLRGSVVKRPPAPDPLDAHPGAAAPESPPPRSRYTDSFPALLEELGISLAVTTYQAGKLVLLAAEGGRLVQRHLPFSKPMGLARSGAGDRLALGTMLEIWHFQRQPGGGFLPRVGHVTGDIRIHEMAWDQDALWFVNTRFNCLCTLDGVHSFVPRWRPPFISALVPEDRCHLNGLCFRPAGATSGLVTALGETDTAGGWRSDKSGGLLMEVPSGEVLVRGLCMPHAPRWHDGRVWLLESGRGSFGGVDVARGRYQDIAVLPGFTRGLDFCGRFAFIGLSQVRETATFGGTPIAERALRDRACGVWVVDTVTGTTVASLRFEDGVQEIFAVQVLHGIRSPDLVRDDRGLLADTFDL